MGLFGKHRETIQQGIERYDLQRMGVDVEPPQRLPKEREIGHIFYDGRDLAPATRHKFKFWAKKGETFKRGPDHVHPPNGDGKHDDHRFHILQPEEARPRSRGLLTIFRRNVQNLKQERKEKRS